MSFSLLRLSMVLFSFIQCLYFWELVRPIHKTQNRLKNEACGPEIVKLQKKTEELLITGLGKRALGCHHREPEQSWMGGAVFCIVLWVFLQMQLSIFCRNV